MAAPRKDPMNSASVRRGRPVEAGKDPATRDGAIRRIADQLDVHPEALRTWVKRAGTDEGLREGTTSQDAARIAELEREVKELRRANAILKSASAIPNASNRPTPSPSTSTGSISVVSMVNSAISRLLSSKPSTQRPPSQNMHSKPANRASTKLGA
ncbi:hypothetical protein DP939_44960 [Spongiactinospora rosea]|uniref:Transposase n=1 Tax=Spongiactinospora rosea TaxID=2248750 RepID=A0A366LD02_9ACTN|nr:hypothetical protein DP939_44960 [Spongiactinospora rosea]